MEKPGHRLTGKGGTFYYEENGITLAEMVYVMAGEKMLIIEHTDVNISLKGKGVGKKLLAALVDYARIDHIQVIPLCPFAKAVFEKTREWQDVLSPIRIKPKTRK